MHHLSRITCHSPLGFMPHDYGYDYDYDSGHDYDHDYDYHDDYVSLISSDFPCLRSLYVQITVSKLGGGMWACGRVQWYVVIIRFHGRCEISW